MNNRFLCSDHHFFHGNILTFCPDSRPFDNVDEMNEEIIKRHNAMISPKDIVYFVGDVVMGGKKNLPIVSRLNGTKKLIAGNHDAVRSGMSEYLQYFDCVEAVREFGRKLAITSHYPVPPQQLEVRYKINIHGHTHQNYVLLVDGSIDPRYYNVCLDANNLMPTPWEDIMKHVDNNL